MDGLTFVIGTAEDIEAEYGFDKIDGYDCDWAIVEFYNGDFSQYIPMDDLKACKAELVWVEDRKTISYL